MEDGSNDYQRESDSNDTRTCCDKLLCRKAEKMCECPLSER